MKTFVTRSKMKVAFVPFSDEPKSIGYIRFESPDGTYSGAIDDNEGFKFLSELQRANRQFILRKKQKLKKRKK